MAYRAYYPWQKEVHARRALALNPNQAHSAVVLMPILTRTGRAEESLKLAEQALKYATGRAKSLLEGRVRTAKTAIFQKTGRWPDKPQMSREGRAGHVQENHVTAERGGPDPLEVRREGMDHVSRPLSPTQPWP